MSRLIIPTREEVLFLASVRADACVSIYLETSPLKLHADSCRIELGGMVKQALTAAQERGLDKRRLAVLEEQLQDVAGAEDFCLFQANSLALFVTEEFSRIYRLANNLSTQLEVSDRFYVKPLMRSLTFNQRAFILALSDNEAKVIELMPDAEPQVLKPEDMPRSALKALGYKSLRASIRDPANSTAASERKKRLADYARVVDEAMRPVVVGCETPVILAATEPMASIFRSVSTLCLAEETVFTSPDKLPDHELVELARPVLDKHYAKEVNDLKELFEQRAGQNRVVTDIKDAARAATYGMISLAMVDFDKVITGTVDEDGNVNLSAQPGEYGVIDEIVCRAMESGARIVAVREGDMAAESGIAAILRYPLPEINN